MDTLDFLQRVLPEDGIYACAVLTNNKKFVHVFTDSAEELARNITKLNRKGQNVFFAYSSFTKERRNQKAVHATKVIALDIDCGKGKPYATQKDGVKSLKKFLKASALPTPMIVSSGNGLHCYWVLKQALPPEQWKPIADGVKKLAQDYGLEIDPTVTGDSARVLRPTGTINPKGGGVVRLLVDQPPVSLSVFDRVVVNHTKPRQSRLAAALKVEVELPPAVSTIVRSKCQQIAWATSNPDDVPEPFWYSLMGVAAYCHDPEETAKEWSSGHSSFDPTAAVAKMYQWKNSTDGPATCKRFENERPKGCQGCPFAGKITTPARLGAQFKEIETSDDAPDREASSIQIPKPFKRTASGIKVSIEDTDIDVCPFDIYPVSYGRDDTLGYEVVRYHWNRPHTGWQELLLRQALLVEGSRDFGTAIADQGIVLTGKRQTEYFQFMLRSYMDELKKKRAMTNLYGSMGWKHDNTEFVLGNTIIRRTKQGIVETKQISLDASGNSKSGDMYECAGDGHKWAQFTNILEKADMVPHMLALGVGFSSVFYAFTGLKGLTISLYGPTGGGKTLAQYWIQSIYGNPDLLHFSSKFTQNSLFHRMGSYCHLPMTIDEVTLMSDKEVADFVYWVSQGKDKARLTRQAQEKDLKEWSMPVVVSTNRSVTSKLIAAGLDSEAQMMRVLEFNVGSHKALTKGSSVGKKIYEFLMSNYGHVGQEFIKRLVALGPDAVNAMVKEAPAVLRDKFECSFAGEERYWEQAISLAYLSLSLAHEWDLIAFQPDRPIQWVLEELGAIRKQVDDAKPTAFDILSEFLNDNASASAVVMHTGMQVMVDHNRLPKGELRVRFDLYRTEATKPFERGTIMMDRAFLRKWLSLNGIDYKRFIADLQMERALATPPSERAYLGRDTPIKLGQTYVVGVNLAHEKLKGILNQADEDPDNITLGNLRSV